jgi:acetyl esterase/lipase
MLIVHGGGWVLAGRYTVALSEPYARRWERWGWETLTPDYRPLADGYKDVLATLDRARRLAGRRPVCIWGASAGAQLGLMVATRRHAACIIGEAAVTDLRTLPPQTERLAKMAFPDLAAMSPVLHAQAISASVLLSGVPGDPMVPFDQQLAFKHAHKRTHLFRLKPATDGNGRMFIHSRVTARSLGALKSVERRFAALAARSH